MAMWRYVFIFSHFQRFSSLTLSLLTRRSIVPPSCSLHPSGGVLADNKDPDVRSDKCLFDFILTILLQVFPTAAVLSDGVLSRSTHVCSHLPCRLIVHVAVDVSEKKEYETTLNMSIKMQLKCTGLTLHGMPRACCSLPSNVSAAALLFRSRMELTRVNPNVIPGA